MKVSIDFETFSVGNLKRIGAWAYAAHTTTEILCLSWTYDGRTTYLWYPGSFPAYEIMYPGIDQYKDKHLQTLFDNIKKGCKVYAWNAYFEYIVWNLCGVRNYDWPMLDLASVYDTMAIAKSLALPGPLGTCGQALGLDTLKDGEGKRLIHKLSKPRKPSQKNPDTRWTRDTATEDFIAFFEYCRQDVLAENAIHNRLECYELSPFERRMWIITQYSNNDGIPIDIDRVNIIVDQMLQYENQLTQELQHISNYEIKTANQVIKIMDYIEFWEGRRPEDLSKETVAAMIKDDTLSKTTRRILEIRRDLAKAGTKKYLRMLEMADDRNRVHDILRYHQASTGRWGGAGIQPQNFPRDQEDDVDMAIRVIDANSLELTKMFYDNPLKLGSRMIRSMIKAENGYRLLVSDFSGIENRVLCWLAGDQAALALFAKGVDQYKWFATKLYPGTSYEDVTKPQRTHAKTCILGLGYGMGAPKFLMTCQGYGMAIDRDTAQKSVNIYRNIYSCVTKFWYDLHKMAFHTIMDGASRRCGRLACTLKDGFLFMHLPSKRKIAYYQPKIEQRMAPWGEMKPTITYMGYSGGGSGKWTRVETSPGKLTENATQAVARDLLADAKLRLTDAGYDVLFSVHDEIVICDKVERRSLQELNDIMCQTDQRTYPGLPIDVEGYQSERYRKG